MCEIILKRRYIMIKKSCYTCISHNTEKEKFPCDKCHNQNNWNYRFGVQSLCLAGVGLIIFAIIVL